MAKSHVVAGVGISDEMLGSALKENGFQYVPANSSEEVIESKADFVLFDSRQKQFKDELQKLNGKIDSPIVSYIESKGISRQELLDLRRMGSTGYLSSQTPSEEIILRVKASIGDKSESKSSESRSARRVWFQQHVEFSIFDKVNKAWSTTLSETGIFLRTPLSFPLYSVLHMKFDLWGDDQEPFEADGVVVRQEVEGELKGLGVMFQNLKGESVRRLESFFEIYRGPTS